MVQLVTPKWPEVATEVWCATPGFVKILPVSIAFVMRSVGLAPQPLLFAPLRSTDQPI